ncbi:unnamed protein product [Rotaria socialis]|uniref:Uncharacterized protein n=1 Tax=Rotaria socialis TaxID=392032 RepID=A0A818XKZ7_9BILA|nr:unnamed protein product [Rotaria socialis]CAF4423354.1 unnamed protein product [Rotaria socialis]
MRDKVSKKNINYCSSDFIDSVPAPTNVLIPPMNFSAVHISSLPNSSTLSGNPSNDSFITTTSTSLCLQPIVVDDHDGCLPLNNNSSYTDLQTCSFDDVGELLRVSTVTVSSVNGNETTENNEENLIATGTKTDSSPNPIAAVRQLVTEFLSQYPEKKLQVQDQKFIVVQDYEVLLV